jgi:Circularly permutated YpsA SLOG family/Domain of unknown function (DUF6794)
MIHKIISGGQTGADQAALDAAIKLGIAYGGWIPKGRLTEEGALPDKYNLTEMPSSSYPLRTDQNVIEATGTLIVSHGQLTEGSDYTRKMAIKHHRPWIHIDLNQTPAFKAATLISAWSEENNIDILNVAGPRASKDEKIYPAVLKLIESVHYLELMKTGRLDSAESKNSPGTFKGQPSTVDEAVERLKAELDLKEKAAIANMAEDELAQLNSYLGRFILDKFGLRSGNEKLVESCLSISDYPLYNEDDAVAVIVKELWHELMKSHRLRVIK